MADTDDTGEGTGLLATLDARAAALESQPADEPDAPEPAAAAPEPVSEPEPRASEPPVGHVPLATLIAERTKRRETERRLAELEARQNPPAAPASAATVTTAAAAPEVPTVKYEDNPAEWLRQHAEIQASKAAAIEKRLESEVDAYRRQEAEHAQVRQQQEFVARLDDEYRGAWEVRAAQDPAVLKAHAYLHQEFVNEAIAVGRTRQQAEAMFIQAERQMAYDAFNAGLDPVDMVVNRAKARRFQVAQSAPAAAAVSPDPAPPQAARAAPAAAPKGPVSSAAKSLSAAPGAAVHKPGLSEINSMSDREYAAWKRANKDGFEKLISRSV